jgi:hypothetical protein
MFIIQMKLPIGGWRLARKRTFKTRDEAVAAYGHLLSEPGYRIIKVPDDTKL